MKTMLVLKDGFEVERAVEKEFIAERTLYGGCTERQTIRLPRLESDELLIRRGDTVFIRSRRIPG